MNFISIYTKQYRFIHGILFFLILCFLILANPFLVFRFDCRQYWELTKQFNTGEGFRLLNFNEPLRGYLFPLILYPSYAFAQIFHLNEVLTCRIYLTVFFSLIYAYGSGKVFTFFFKENWHPWIHGLFGFFLLVLWWEYFTLPLSDAIGLVFLFAVFIIPKKQLLIFYFLSGALLYAAVNTRLVYVIAIPAYYAWLLLDKGEIKAKYKSILLSLTGFLLMATPQYYINTKNFKEESIFVPTHLSKETGGKNVYFMQLNWGLRIQKYETNIGMEYPIPEVRYIDSLGNNLSIGHGNKDFESYTEYFGFVLNHSEILRCYLHHAFNALDITTPKAYLTKGVYHRNPIHKVFNFTLLYIGILSFILFFRKTSLSARGFIMLLILVFAILLPTAIEVRYFMPIHFIIYFYACFLLQQLALSSEKLKRKTLVILILGCLCFISVGVLISNSRMNLLEYKEVIP